MPTVLCTCFQRISTLTLASKAFFSALLYFLFHVLWRTCNPCCRDHYIVNGRNMFRICLKYLCFYHDIIILFSKSCAGLCREDSLNFSRENCLSQNITILFPKFMMVSVLGSRIGSPRIPPLPPASSLRWGR